MAPELLTGDEYNLKADVYSFGIVLWQMFSCQTPYNFCTNQKQLINFVVEENGRPGIDEKWPRFIQGMLETSFASRSELRPKMSGFHEMIKVEIARLRGGESHLLTHAHINRRRSTESIGSNGV